MSVDHPIYIPLDILFGFHARFSPTLFSPLRKLDQQFVSKIALQCISSQIVGRPRLCFSPLLRLG